MEANQPGNFERPADTAEHSIDLRESTLAARNLLDQLDEACEHDPHQRLVTYGLLLGLGARKSRAALLSGEYTTDRFRGVPVHDIYHVLLDGLALTGRQLLNNQPPPDETLTAFFKDMYPLYSRPTGTRQRVSQERFCDDLLLVAELKRGYFERRQTLENQQKPAVLLFDKVSRFASERVFLREARPFIDSDSHLPLNFLDPALLRDFCDPGYWQEGGSWITSKQRATTGNEHIFLWMANEYRYWDYVAGFGAVPGEALMTYTSQPPHD